MYVERSPINHEALEITPKIRGGKPCITGTKISISQIIAELAMGEETLTELTEDMDMDFRKASDALELLAYWFDNGWPDG